MYMHRSMTIIDDVHVTITLEEGNGWTLRGTVYIALPT